MLRGSSHELPLQCVLQGHWSWDDGTRLLVPTFPPKALPAVFDAKPLTQGHCLGLYFHQLRVNKHVWELLPCCLICLLFPRA